MVMETAARAARENEGEAAGYSCRTAKRSFVHLLVRKSIVFCAQAANS
jgi:hypothetical protein